MSSQMLATPVPGGLPASSPPGTDLVQSTWTDHMEADRTNESGNVRTETDVPRERTSSSSQTSPDNSLQQRQALSNLLAALAPIAPSQPAQADQIDGRPRTHQVNETVSPAQAEVAGNQTPLANGNSAQVSSDMPTFANTPIPPNSSVELPPFPPATYTPHPHPAMSMTGLALPDPFPNTNAPQSSAQDRREVEAFAKIEFEDGNYYITTWQCELGRDALAFRAAVERAEEARNNPAQPQSSSGRISRPSDRIRRAEDSQMQGSVVSEAGGFGGIDEAPVASGEPRSDNNGHPSHSSQMSNSDVVRPQEVLYHPPTVPFDYHRNAELQAQVRDPDWEQPAPVTAEHMPDASQCPIIPIHAMANSVNDEVATHKGISRRHVRIEWDFEDECFKMKVLGRNGAFLDDEWMKRGSSKRLNDGSKIQISDVEMRFRLPRPKTEPLTEGSDRDVAAESPFDRHSTSPTSNEAHGAGQHKVKITLTHHSAASPTFPEPLIGPDGQPIVRKRGPGRPPKDGIMSTRERKEREKAAKLAEAKANNGGRTPPPNGRPKPLKQPTAEELAKADAKQERRKYNKRKRDGEEGDVLPSIEGGEENIESATPPPAKKPRPSKSPSPEYPPLHTLTEEQLLRPQAPYATVIYDLLLEIHPRALPLKQIYRAIKMKYPHYVYRVESDGWQSSVRHNLNQEWNKLFEKGDKEGKGFAWRAIPGAANHQQERKRAVQQTAAPKPKLPPAPRNPPPPQHQNPGQPMNWQNGQPYPPPYWPQGQQGPLQPQHPPPNGMPPNGMPYPPLPGTMPPHPPQGHGPPQMPPAPNGIPPPQMLPTSQSSTPQPAQNFQRPSPHGLQGQPQPPTSSAAAPNMPYTLDGLMAMRRYEQAMYEFVRRGGYAQAIEFWQQIFISVKNRLLHGAPRSNMPGGETQEEVTIFMEGRKLLEQFRNVNFVGFDARKGTPDAVSLPVVGMNEQMPGLRQGSVHIGSPVPAVGINLAAAERRGSGAGVIDNGQGNINNSHMLGQIQIAGAHPAVSNVHEVSKTASPHPPVSASGSPHLPTARATATASPTTQFAAPNSGAQ